MGDWMTVVILILIGLVLIYLELIFVPGTTILGLVGIALTGIGVYLAFERHGSVAGGWVLGGSFFVITVAVVYSFRSGAWKRFSLQTKSEGHFNENFNEGLQIEMRGETISDLKPIGKAEFNAKSYEVRSRGEHVSAGQAIKIAKIIENKIIVELIKKED